MQFTRIFATLFTFLALGVFASATPVAQPEKRALESEVLSIVTGLYANVQVVIGEITVLSPLTATLVEISPLVAEVEILLSGAATSLSLLDLLKRDELSARQLDGVATEIAGVLGDLVSSLTGALDPFSGLSGLTGLTSVLDSPLSNVLVVVEGLIPGILTLVAGLLVTVVGLLSSLGLTGLLGILPGL